MIPMGTKVTAELHNATIQAYLSNNTFSPGGKPQAPSALALLSLWQPELLSIRVGPDVPTTLCSPQ